MKVGKGYQCSLFRLAIFDGHWGLYFDSVLLSVRGIRTMIGQMSFGIVEPRLSTPSVSLLGYYEWRSAFLLACTMIRSCTLLGNGTISRSEACGTTCEKETINGIDSG
jgi:hypothetical protein